MKPSLTIFILYLNFLDAKPLTTGDAELSTVNRLLHSFYLARDDVDDQPSDKLKNSELDKFHLDKSLSNETAVVLELLPIDDLCDFCLAVVEKLKERQRDEEDFEKKIKEECLNNNSTEKNDGTVCELINKVNLDRLRDDSNSRICADEGFCGSSSSHEKKNSADVQVHDFSESKDEKKNKNTKISGDATAEKIPKVLVDRTVEMTMIVEDIA